MQISITAVAICLCSALASAQDFDDAVFWNREALIDTLLAKEAFAESIPLIENQIKYVKQTGRPDSLYRYTYNLGHAYLVAHGKDAAISETEKFVDWIEENVSNQHHVLESISDLSWVYYEAGKDSLCYETDLRYLKICDNFAKANPKERSIAHYSLGYDFLTLFGNVKKGLYHFEKSLVPVLEDSMKYKTRVLDCMNAIGATHYQNGTLLKSQVMLQRALNFSKVLPDSVSKWLQQANILGNLALGYEQEGNLVKEKDYLYEAMRMRKQAIDSIKIGYQRDQQRHLLISNYSNLAALNLKIGDISKADKLTRYVDLLRREWLVPDHPDNSKTFEAFGSIDYALGDYDSALSNFEKYLQDNIAKNGRNSFRTATGYQRIGKVLYEKQDYAGAIKNYSQTIQIGKDIITDEYGGSDLAQVYLLRSKPYAALGQYDLAEKDIYSARHIYSNSLPANSPVFGQLNVFLADLKIERHQLDSAQYYIDLALKNLLGKQQEQEEQYKSDLSGYSGFLPRAYQTQATIILALGQDTISEKQALHSLTKAIMYLRKTRNIYAGETSLLTLYDENNAIFNKIEDLAYNLYEETSNKKYLNLLFELDEENKSVLIRRHLNSFTSLRVSNVPDTIITRERMLLSKLSDESGTGEEAENIEQLEADYQKLVQNIKENYPAYYALRYNEKVANLDQIKDHLIKPGKNIVQYILTDTNVYAIVLNSRQTDVIKLDGTQLMKNLNQLNNSIIAMDQETFENISSWLYRTIFEPIESLLIGEEVLIIPDGNLFNINFETLIKPSHSKEPDYLINHYIFSYLLSSTTSIQYQKLKSNKTGGLLAFAPGFFDDLKAKYIAEVKDPNLIDEQYIHNIQQPFAVASAHGAAGIFNGRAYVSGEATERNFKEEADKYKIIHLGTHTEINNLSPLLSRLVLSKDSDNESADDDGYLHAYEIYNLSLRAELAVLTACETGVGKSSSSEGVLSLAHSFAYAGCPSIVMSLWQIDEKTSSGIIEDFYKNLANGMPKNTALRDAKLLYLKNHPGELSSPYYWSGLVLLGDTSPISATSNNSVWLFVILGVVALIFATFFIPIRRKAN